MYDRCDSGRELLESFRASKVHSRDDFVKFLKLFAIDDNGPALGSAEGSISLAFVADDDCYAIFR